jgi:hypothetical protein
LKNRNSNYRDYFINKGATQKDVELKNHLDEQCKVAADNLMKKKKEFEKMKKECDEIANRIGEMNNKVYSTPGVSKILIERNFGCPKKDCH